MENIANFSRPVKQDVAPNNHHDQSWDSWNAGSNLGSLSADTPDEGETTSADMPDGAVGMTPEDFCKLVLPLESPTQVYVHDTGTLASGERTVPKKALGVGSFAKLVAETMAIDRMPSKEVWFSPAAYSRAGFDRPRSAGQGTKASETGGRKSHNVALLKTLRWDLDVDASGRKGDKPCHKDRDVALASMLRVLADMGLRPSVVVSSGNGHHVYLALETALPPDKWRKLAQRFEAAIIAGDSRLGADTKRWTDPNGLLRMPGTYNKKNPSAPKLVEIVGGTGKAVANDVASDAVPMAGESTAGGGARRESSGPSVTKAGSGSLVTQADGWCIAYDAAGQEFKRWRVQNGQREVRWPDGRTETKPWNPTTLGGAHLRSDWDDVSLTDLVGLLKRIPPTTGDMSKVVMCIRAWGLAHDDAVLAEKIGDAWFAPAKPGEAHAYAKRFPSSPAAGRMTVGTLHHHATKGDEAAEVDPSTDDMRKRVAESLDAAGATVPEIAEVANREAIERAHEAAAETFEDFCRKHENRISGEHVGRALSLMSQKYRVANTEGSTAVYRRDRKREVINATGENRRLLTKAIEYPVWTRLNEKSLGTELSNVLAEGKDAKGHPVWKCIAGVWMSRREGATLRNARFAPGTGLPPDELNIFTGWPVAPKQGDWSLLKKHMLDNLCNGNTDHFNYLMAWCADIFQQPAVKPGVAVILRGRKGTGKSKLSEWLARALTGYSFVLDRMEQVTGRFGAHLERLLFLGLEEGLWGGDRKSEGAFKNLITGGTVPIEGKGVDIRNAASFMRLMVTSNEEWVVPATADERRFFVLDVGDARRQDTNYFATIDQQMMSGGLEAMVNELMTMSIGHVDLRKAPVTDGLRDQILHGVDPVAKWWLDVLLNGAVHDGIVAHPISTTDETAMPKVAIYASIEKSKLFARAMSATKVGMWFGAHVPAAKPARGRAGSDERAPVYRLPTLRALRADATKRWGLTPGHWKDAGCVAGDEGEG